jgi:hypothetical protein
MMHAPPHARSKFFCDNEGKIVILQAPNIPLVAWFCFGVLARLFNDGTMHQGFHLLSQAFLFAWAYLEIRSGASPFRRAFGCVVMLGLLAAFFR